MAARVLRYNDGESIIKSGSFEQRMYIIIEGCAEISLTDGKNKIMVDTMKRGDFFGEISLFNNIPRSANVVAKGMIKLAYIDNLHELKIFLVKNPNFAAKMVHILAKRLAKTDELLISQVSKVNRLQVTN